MKAAFSISQPAQRVRRRPERTIGPHAQFHAEFTSEKAPEGAFFE
ncbi:MAG: hypothetical protein Q8Q84_00995 [Hydrogenophaga sp.]|nr:hypothetical protein [Hydrogenophaga sp.]